MLKDIKRRKRSTSSPHPLPRITGPLNSIINNSFRHPPKRYSTQLVAEDHRMTATYTVPTNADETVVANFGTTSDSEPSASDAPVVDLNDIDREYLLDLDKVFDGATGDVTEEQTYDSETANEHLQTSKDDEEDHELVENQDEFSIFASRGRRTLPSPAFSQDSGYITSVQPQISSGLYNQEINALDFNLSEQSCKSEDDITQATSNSEFTTREITTREQEKPSEHHELELQQLEQIIGKSITAPAICKDEDGAKEKRESDGFDKRNIRSRTRSLLSGDDEKVWLDELSRENEQLRRNLDIARQKIDILSYEKDIVIFQMRDQHEQYVRDSKAVGQDKHQSHQTLQSRIAQLEEELEGSRSAQSQLSAIRASLEREKELDVLTAKKEVMSQKVRALQDMRRDMQREREEAERKWREEGDQRDEDAKRQKEAWQEQLKEANARIRELVKEKAKMVKESRDNNDNGQHRISGETLEKLQEQINVLTSWQDEVTTRLNVVVSELRQSPTDSEGNPDSKDMIDWLKTQFENKDVIIRRLERQLKFKEDLIEGMKRSTEKQMEDRLTNIKEGMRKEYQQTIEELKRNYRSSNVVLSPFNRQSLVPLPHATVVTLQELLSTYPLQFAEYKSTIEVTHRTTLDNLHCQNDAAVANLVSRFATEKEHTISKHRLEISDLRKKYQRAFEKSVRKCIEDPERLEIEALRLMQRDRDEAIAKTEKRWQHLESVWQQENLELKQKLLAAEERTDSIDDDNIAEYDNQIKTLNNAFARAEEQLRQRIGSAEGKDAHVHYQMEQNEIKRLQKQYIQTLKIMRDKVLQNKTRSAERMELEWTRRRILLEEQWAQSTAEIKIRHADMAQLRQTANATATVLTAAAGRSGLMAPTLTNGMRSSARASHLVKDSA